MGLLQGGELAARPSDRAPAPARSLWAGVIGGAAVRLNLAARPQSTLSLLVARLPQLSAPALPFHHVRGGVEFLTHRRLPEMLQFLRPDLRLLRVNEVLGQAGQQSACLWIRFSSSPFACST